MTKNIDIDVFKKLYYSDRLPIEEVADKINVTKSTIYEFIKKNNLTTRKTHYSTVGAEFLTKELLEKLYIEDNKSIPEISKEISLSKTMVFRKLREFNISSKQVGARMTYKFERDELYNKYWIENKTTYEIADDFGVSPTTIYRSFVEHQIPFRQRNYGGTDIIKDVLSKKYVDEEKSSYQIAEEFGVTQSIIYNLLVNYGIPIRPHHPDISYISEEYLYKMYITEEKDTYEIAEKLGIAQSSIFKLLKKYNIKTRTTGEVQKGKTGPLARGWRGGLSFYPYCPKFNKPLKEEIREEFGRVCFVCGKDEEQNGKKLHIHHVDYNKSQGCGHKWALIPLCNSCHLRTNGHRWYYFNLFINYWAREICLNFPGFPEFYPHYFELM